MNRILIVAGEASGDHHGAALIRELNASDSNLRVWGIGGNALQQAGAELVARSDDLGVTGLWEVLSKSRIIWRAYRAILRRAEEEKPDLAILIDYPDFNLRLAAALKRMNIPVLYYVSPQVWAWRQKRVYKIKKCVDEMLVVFPFEEKLYRDAGVPVKFVGHPLLEDLTPGCDEVREPGAKPIVALLPGSRKNEIKRLMPPILAAVRDIAAVSPDVEFELALAPTIRRESIESYLKDFPMRVKIVENDLVPLLRRSSAAIVCSGTATLQAGLAKLPMVVIYKVSPMTYYIGKMLIKPQLFAMANVILGEKVVPELLQSQVTGRRIGMEILKYLQDNNYSSSVRNRLGEIRGRLGDPGASKVVAGRVREYLGRVNV